MSKAVKDPLAQHLPRWRRATPIYNGRLRCAAPCSETKKSSAQVAIRGLLSFTTAPASTRYSAPSCSIIGAPCWERWGGEQLEQRGDTGRPWSWRCGEAADAAEEELAEGKDGLRAGREEEHVVERWHDVWRQEGEGALVTADRGANLAPGKDCVGERRGSVDGLGADGVGREFGQSET
ncbi:hypothetical protein B0H19DRAFT_1372941 [Mycena capillaripes]|nr:hypothetical protein B0H19DRAFT_1372941 [Mycena capillaripes]